MRLLTRRTLLGLILNRILEWLFGSTLEAVSTVIMQTSASSVGTLHAHMELHLLDSSLCSLPAGCWFDLAGTLACCFETLPGVQNTHVVPVPVSSFVAQGVGGGCEHGVGARSYQSSPIMIFRSHANA